MTVERWRARIQLQQPLVARVVSGGGVGRSDGKEGRRLLIWLGRRSGKAVGHRVMKTQVKRFAEQEGILHYVLLMLILLLFFLLLVQIVFLMWTP